MNSSGMGKIVFTKVLQDLTKENLGIMQFTFSHLLQNLIELHSKRIHVQQCQNRINQYVVISVGAAPLLMKMSSFYEKNGLA